MAREMHHNPPEQVREYLRVALELVAELEPPEDLRVAVFNQAAALVAAKQVFIDAAEAQPVARPVMSMIHGDRRH